MAGYKNIVIIILPLLLVASCGGGAKTVSMPEPIVNSAPTAVTGGNQTASVGSQITLDGRNSSDPDGDNLSYQWSFVSIPIGSNASLNTPALVQTTFVPDVAGDFVVSLAVTDPSGAMDSISITVSASGAMATFADAGPDQNVTTSFLVQFDGSNSGSPSGDLLDYAWSIVSQPSGANVFLSDASVVDPTFVPSMDGQYVIDLIVRDNVNADSSDTVVVNSTTGNSAPVAAAGDDQAVLVANLVRLDGSGSSDGDGDLLTYQWSMQSQPSGSSSALSGADTAAPTFVADVAGIFTVSLVVSDSIATSAVDVVEITSLAGNAAPQANAGIDTNVQTGELVLLDGSGSSDPEGAPLSYNWQFVSKPGGSNAQLTSSSAVNPSFTPDVDGTYVVDLVVSDGSLFSTGDRVSVISSTANSAPNANAGTDQNVSVGETVTLDGSASNDADGDPLFYVWTFSSRPTGSTATLSVTNQVMPTFVADAVGSFVVNLVVNDGAQSSPIDSVTINSTDSNSVPVANAGIDQSVFVGDLVNLDGNASMDADGDPLTYVWRFISLPGSSAATLNSSTSVVASFTADVTGSFVVGLVVNDGLADSLSDALLIDVTAANNAPTAVAGPDQSGIVGANITLDGSSSTDPDSDSLSYLWSFVSMPTGSSAVLNSPTSALSSFVSDMAGSYVVQLVVNDGTENSVSDQLLVNIIAGNQAPVASAGTDQSATTGDLVSLNGSGSFDGDGDPLTFEWSFTSQPGGSTAVLSSTTSSAPSFTADLDGTYIVQLVVNDGFVNSQSDSTTIVSSTPGGGVSVTDSFDGDGPLLNYTTNNASVLPDVSRNNGRYHARLIDNTNDATLHFNSSQGRLDAKLVSFPFEYIARNVGIGTLADSQTPPAPSGDVYMFAGIQIHVTDLNSRNSAHFVVGHRGSQFGAPLTIEGKNTVNGSSSVNDAGANIVPAGRADLRVVAQADKSLTWYWQQPNSSPGVQADNWVPYRGTGSFPGAQANFGDQVYIGLITYAFRESSVPFVGTADSVELVGE